MAEGETRWAVGRLLRDVRVERGDSLRHAAARMELTPVALGEIERMVRDPTPTEMDEIRSYFALAPISDSDDAYQAGLVHGRGNRDNDWLEAIQRMTECLLTHGIDALRAALSPPPDPEP